MTQDTENGWLSRYGSERGPLARPQDNESAFGRGFRNGYGASDGAQDQDMWSGVSEAYKARNDAINRSLEPDHTGTMMICGTILLVALIAALCFLKRKPEGVTKDHGDQTSPKG